MVWPGMNQVDLISQRASISSKRLVATAPNSPREIALGEVAFRLPSHKQIASKSNDRQTATLVAIRYSSMPGAVASDLIECGGVVAQDFLDRARGQGPQQLTRGANRMDEALGVRIVRPDKEAIVAGESDHQRKHPFLGVGA